ncbi:MAG: hypothetical protein IKC31_02130 [Clostridia bacterium]|nr:hypothetical protein [Clostridia bacterium]
MKLNNRILSTLLAVIMMVSALTGVLTVGASAAEEDTSMMTPEIIESTYTSASYKQPAERLAKMKLVMEAHDYKLYIDTISGEVVTEKISTGELLFSTPYDMGGDKDMDARVKKQILSQIVVQYTDNGVMNTLYSFEEAAMRKQIKVMNIKNGVRVEYVIGREETRKLLPQRISAVSFDKYILGPMEEAIDKGILDEFYFTKFYKYYTPIGLEIAQSERERQSWIKSYPCIEELIEDENGALVPMNIYVFDSTVGDIKENWCESFIKEYCPDYSFEQMEADHEQTGYEASNEQYPVFKMALEYSLDENGMTVRLPCNGLRYDMSMYTLEYLSVLPYMGAGNILTEGYNFYPDGSGSLFYSDLGRSNTVRGKVYGVDYAYHNIVGTYQKAIRYPIYGTVATETIYSYSYSYLNGNMEMMVNSETVSATVKSFEKIQDEISKRPEGELLEIKEETYSRGYLAIIESGESLAEISSYHAGSSSNYYTMMNFFNPKPNDSYDISDSISVTNSSTWTVVSNRKYTGSFKLRYLFLSDANKVEEAKQFTPNIKYYDATWLGMAEAYRDYLVNTGVLEKMTEEDITEDIPLYMEVFGTLQTTQRFLTVPVKEMTPLTTFENVYSIYEKLYNSGVKNVNFKLTGFANGGMYAKVPSSLKWESAVGGAKKLEWLIDKSEEISQNDENAKLGLYPDFDFAYIRTNTLLDAVNLKRDAVKTIDNRYTSLRQYSATQQSYVTFHDLAISPSRYSSFYDKLLKNYAKYDLMSMSVASLGTALNSDFDEDDPYNRENNKDYTIRAFEDMQDAGYSLMTDGGNAYTWGYVDHLVNVDLDSSRYIRSGASVPFIGAVLHGYVQFAGTPFNEEGDSDYAILKAIENGASLYFILSYQNTNELKEDPVLNQYYGIRYDIWEADVIESYKELNELLKDIQLKVIVEHDFLPSERVLDLDELEADLADKLQAALDSAAQNQVDTEMQRYIEIANAFKSIAKADEIIGGVYQELLDACVEVDDAYAYVRETADRLNTQIVELLDAIVEAKYDFEATTVSDRINGGEGGGGFLGTVSGLRKNAVDVLRLMANMDVYQENVDGAIAELTNAKDILRKAVAEGYLEAEVAEAYYAKADVIVTEVQHYSDDAKAAIEALKAKGYDDINSSECVAQIAYNALTVLTSYRDGSGTQEQSNAARLLMNRPDVREVIRFEVADLFEEAGAPIDGEGGEDGGNNGGDINIGGSGKDSGNNRVVVVTYGDRNPETNEKTFAKTFLLNYNSYTVRVTYNNVTYTIPSNGYVVIEY